MIEDKIQLLLKELKKIKDELKDIKKDIKDEEKLDTQEYMELKKAFEDLRKQKKEIEERWKEELAKDNGFQELRELKVQKEEEMAEINAKIFSLINELPAKPFIMSMETEEGPLKIQIMPEMRLYLNGKEEKKRA
jgi:SMC interacting uncharacterized protein involved in chromosome segregation